MNEHACYAEPSAAIADAPDDRATAVPSPRVIVAFVGENENGILRSVSRKFLDLMTPAGFEGHVVDLHAPGWEAELKRLLRRGILFGWGFAGVGARLRLDQCAVWDTFGIPFVSVLADSPCYMPANHRIESTYIANGYLYRSWFDIQRRMIRAPQISAMLPPAVPSNAARDVRRWSSREHRMLFVKTGRAPDTHRLQWMGLPQRFRAVVEDTAAAVLRHEVGDITGTYLQCLDNHDLFLEERPEILFSLMSMIDSYVRDFRSTAMVQALLDLPVDIVGRGWDHLKSSGCRARFHDAVDADRLPGLYANTQFLLNTMPNFSTATHERVLDGFAAKCCVVTNENAEMRIRFGGLPSYFGVDTGARDLPDRLASIHDDDRSFDELLQPALDLVHSEFSGEGFVCALINLANEIAMGASPSVRQRCY